MTIEDFIEGLTSEQVKEYFINLDESEQVQIFRAAVVKGCNNPDADFYNFDDDFFNEFFEDNPAEAARAVYFGNVQNWNDNYVTFNRYANLETFDDAEAYMLDYLGEMADYIRENYADELAEFFEFEEDEEEDEEESEE